MKRTFLSVMALIVWANSFPVQATEPIPLGGEWRFALDPDDAGMSATWFAKSLAARIRLPGILEAQGYGDEISVHTPWVLSLYDHFWFLRAEYAAYTNSGSVKVPFLCQPPRHYLGPAWYQRDFEIPVDWKGKRIVLFLERPHWKSTVWLDDAEMGSDMSLCTPHEYSFGLVQPGRHHLTIRVDNRVLLPYRLDSHSISDSLDDAWNGIIGKIELRASAPVWIDEARVFTSTNNEVRIKVKIGNITGGAGHGKLSVNRGLKNTEVQVVPIDWGTNGAMTEVVFTLAADTPQWDEFQHALQTCLLQLSGGSEAQDSFRVVFGLRDFHADGNQFILNGHPMYFRGTHFGGDFPLTGYPPTDVESWKRIFETCKLYGLNHMRFHSWCPPEAAFQAADELGFYLQVECGMWNSFSPGSDITKQLYLETERILGKFGNHPSLMLISASNEAAGHWAEVLPEWVKHFRAEDSRHLYTPDTGWLAITSPRQPLNGGADYLVCGRIGQGRLRGDYGWFGSDYAESLLGAPVPIIGHEVGQWVAYPNFEVIKKFTGFMRPGNFEIFRDSAAAHGLLERNKEFALASGRFQVECYKEEVEANLRTPGLDGFQLLDLHDYTGQGTALVGLLDPFWQSKGYVTPEEFRTFCSPVTPLARLSKRTFTTAERLEVPVEAANYSTGKLANACVNWEIHDAQGQSVAHGALGTMDLPIGKNIALGTISVALSQLPASAAYTLIVRIFSAHANGMPGLPQAGFSNNWKFWLYPAKIPAPAPSGMMVTASWDAATKALAAGGKVLFTPHNADLDWNSPPLARVPVFWNALMGPTWGRMLGLWCDTRSAALAEFPTEVNCDWQWTELLNNTRAINLDKLPGTLRPIVSAIDDWNRNYKLGLIFEATVGPGKLVVCAADLGNASNPVAQQLRLSLLDYMAGNKFRPITAISVTDFEGLHFSSRIMRQLGATATVNGRRADELIDGDPNTFWSSADARGNGPPPPHEILITFPRPVAMSGLRLMPRQNQREHQGDIREYTVAASDDATNWQTIAQGHLASTFDEQSIAFDRIVTRKCLKLTAYSGFGADHAAALAEIAIIDEGFDSSDAKSQNIQYKNVKTASPDIDAGDSSTGAHKPPP